MAADLQTVQRLHPEWNVTQIAYAPNGGIWAVGRDGGVFALNPEGGTGGENVAPYFGSYTGLAPEQRQGTREFTGIRATGTGYELLSNIPGQNYAFNAPAPTGPVGDTATGGANTPAAGDDTSGKDVFHKSLIDLGFTPEQATNLTNSLWAGSKTKTPDALYLDLVGTPEYAARFPGMAPLRKQGTAISEREYIGIESGYKAAAKSAGLPASFYDNPDDFGKLIASGVSPAEYADRVQWGQTAALSDPTWIDEMTRQVPGFTIGDATAFFLDPDKGTKWLEQKSINATIGTSAVTSGFGQLSMGEIERLSARPGMTPGQAGAAAQAGFAAVAPQLGLFSNTVEEAVSDNQFTREEKLGVVGGDAKAQIELEERRKRRQAHFQGGGGAASGGGGRTGLG